MAARAARRRGRRHRAPATAGASRRAGRARPAPAAPRGPGSRSSSVPDPTVGDGRFANNGWLQELPEPLTKLTWDNAALVSPATASAGHRGRRRRDRRAWRDVVELRYRGRTVRGARPGSAGPPRRRGHRAPGLRAARAGRVGNGVGFDAYALRTSDAPWFGSGARSRRPARATGSPAPRTTGAWRGATWSAPAPLEEFAPDPTRREHRATPADARAHPVPGLRVRGPRLWGMAIDLNACIGCNACVVACQAENNIPVVGKDQVPRPRDALDPHRPLLRGRPDRRPRGRTTSRCPACTARTRPASSVCPVAATVHSDEGLNDMVYNRCVGTRYCSNNCPYKVRRFNFFHYADWTTPRASSCCATPTSPCAAAA